MCYVYKVNVPMMGLRLKRPHTEADLGFEDWEVFGKTQRTCKGFPEEGQEYNSKEKGQEAAWLAEPDNQCGKNGKFRDGQRGVGVGEEAGLSGLAWRWNPTMHKEEW